MYKIWIFQNTKGPGLELFCVITLMSERVHGNSLLQHIAQFNLLFSHVYLFKQKKNGIMLWKLVLEKKSILVILEEYSSEFKLIIFENTSQKTFLMKIPCWIKDLVKWFRLTGINYISSIDKLVIYITRYWGLLSGWLSGKESSFNAGAERDMGSIPKSGRSPGDPHDNPL